MRHFVYIAMIASVAIIVGSCGGKSSGESAGDSDTTGVARLTFNKLEHDFGKITEGERVGCVFTFTNTGEGNLVINSATTSCGCTVPRFDDKPVKPGESGTIEVVFDSSYREGTQTKTITVRSNAEVPVTVLRITAEVINNQ